MGMIGNFFKRRYQNTKQLVNQGLGTAFLKNSTVMIFDTVSSFFKKRAVRKETFAQASQRLQLSDEDLKERAFGLKREIFIYSLSAILILIYAIYLGISGDSLFSITITLLVSGSLATCAFRSHFWLFQLRQKKLGCTMKEWLDSTVKGLN